MNTSATGKSPRRRQTTEPTGSPDLRRARSERRKELAESLMIGSQVVEQSQNSIIVTDSTGKIVSVNKRFEELSGYSRSEVLGKNIKSYRSGQNSPGQNSEGLYKELWSTILNGGKWHGELCNRSKNGTLYWEDSVIFGLRAKTGKITHLVGIHVDITERKHQERELREALRFQEALIQAIPSPIFYKNRECVYVDCNHAFEAFLGEPRENILGKTTYDISPSDHAIHDDEADRKLLENGGVQTYESTVVVATGDRREQRNVIFKKTVITDQEGNVSGLIGVILDITEQKRTEAELRASGNKLRELSIRDQMTGLFNRQHFSEKLFSEIGTAVRLSQPLTVILFDVDNFKHINDRYGHNTGDRVLHKVGTVLKGVLSESDYGFRYGGEEFAVILPMTKLNQAVIIAEKIRENLKKAETRIEDGGVVRVTVSVGVAEYISGDTQDAIMIRADEKMYKSKQNGKDMVSF